MYEGSNCSLFLANTCYCLFYICSPSGCEVVSHVISLCISQIANDEEHLFMLLSAICISSWEKCVFEFFLLIFKLGSVQFSCSVASDSSWPHGPQHTRPPCPSPTPGVYLNSSPSSSCCHPTIASSVIPFSSHLQSFPASGSFQMSQLLASGGQSIGVSASASVLSMNTQDWSPLGWTGWIYLQSKELSASGVFSNTTVQEHHFFSV